MGSIHSFSDYVLEYQRSIRDPETFWQEKAAAFSWRKKWDTVLQWNFEGPDIRWFEGGALNICENCIDRHLAERGAQTAIIFEPNHPEESSRHITYNELHASVCAFANVLLKNGIKRGDRVCIYMPMIPEAAVAMLACARIGAIHSVVFGGFSSQALADRIIDAQASMLITADGAYRGNKQINLKEIADEALHKCECVKVTIVYKRTGQNIQMKNGRDFWWHEQMQLVDRRNEAVSMQSEDTLFILYTSGSTGKPKGVVHTTAGYMVYTAYTFETVFQYRPNEVYWCTADVGWITGHSYIVYGPLLCGATTLMFEGVPSYPDSSRFWQIIEKHGVNIFYTAPTAIRSLMAAGEDIPDSFNMPSLRVLGSVGEPINEEAWHWYHDKVGKKRCSIADTYWQTETGGFMIAPIAGITPTKAAYATLPLPGIQPVLVDQQGNLLEGNGVEGNLCIKFPWPGILRTTYGDHERCKQTYFSTYKGMYFTGDGARRDEEGYYRILGRVDDVINVSGHRIGTAEVENAINEHPFVVESAVVGYPHAIKGQGIWAFVICDHVIENEGDIRKEILHEVTKIIGPIAKPDKIQFVSGLPKTRSGKIMRRLLRKIAEGDISNLGDTSTLIDPAIVDVIKNGADSLRK